VAAAAATGCAGLSHTVDRKLLQGLSLTNKLLLFDAENDVMIALDEIEGIKRDIRRGKQAVADARAQSADAASDRERAEEKGDDKGEELAELAEDVFDLKTDYLNASVDLLRERLDAQEESVLMAQAKYELTKARVVVRSNAAGSTRINLNDYTNQVDEMAERAREAREDVAETKKDVEELKQRWLKERNRLQQASGGGLGSPWVEDSLLWDVD
jgi:chromosome segregation ATPase